MSYGNNNYNGGPLPSNNLWVGNNYSSGSYSQMPRNNYPVMNQAMPSFPVQSQMLQPSQVNNILQVMGPESAQAFQIGPDSQVILMDSSNKPVFYRKKSDSSGYSETRAFTFKEISLEQAAAIISSDNNYQQQPQQQTSSNHEEYITKKDFEEYKKMIEDLVMKDD